MTNYKIFLYGPGEPIFMQWQSDKNVDKVIQDIWNWLDSDEFATFTDVEGTYSIRSNFVSKILVRER